MDLFVRLVQRMGMIEILMKMCLVHKGRGDILK